MFRAWYPEHITVLNSGPVHGGGGRRRGLRKMRAAFLQNTGSAQGQNVRQAGWGPKNPACSWELTH